MPSCTTADLSVLRGYRGNAVPLFQATFPSYRAAGLQASGAGPLPRCRPEAHCGRTSDSSQAPWW